MPSLTILHALVNQSPRGGCMYIQTVILTLNNSDISENFGYDMGAGILADYSRIQVGSGFSNQGKGLLTRNEIQQVTNI